jgi:hypothetical protein
VAEHLVVVVADLVPAQEAVQVVPVPCELFGVQGEHSHQLMLVTFL